MKCPANRTLHPEGTSSVAVLDNPKHDRTMKLLRSVSGSAIVGVVLFHSPVAWAADDLLDNSASPDTGGSSFSIQTDNSTSNVWYQALRFDATEPGDVTQISLRLEVASTKQNAAAAATSVQIYSNDSNNELDTSLATFTYSSHSLVSTTGSRDDIAVTYAGNTTLATGTYWLATFSTGDRDTDNESASLTLSSLTNQVYEGPWRWVAGEQNRYSQALTSGYSTSSSAPLVVIIGVRRNPPAPSPESDSAPQASSSVSVTLHLALPAGISCDTSALQQSSGPWVQLPSASDCFITSRAGTDGPSLLGWATNENFPVDIAQRQVDNGWGAYEDFNDDGQLDGVFIPAGGYAAVTGDTNLYPIWSE